MTALIVRTNTRLITLIASCALLSGGIASSPAIASPDTVSVGQAASADAPDPRTQQNVALGKPASQSSTDFGGDAGRAVDGDTSGDWYVNSVTHTTNGPGEWWQVDLGSSVDIREIVLWNRTDCCAERLHDIIVLVSETPFPSGAVASPTGWSTTIVGPAGRETHVSVGSRGRYVRIQHTVADYLSLAEVEVLAASGPAPTDGAWNLIGSPRNQITKGSMDARYAETISGGAGSASISISIQPPDPGDPPSIRAAAFTWAQPPATLRPGDRMTMTLAVSETASRGPGYYSSSLFARFTRPGQPCGVVRGGDLDVGVVMVGALTSSPPSGTFTVPAPATGFSDSATDQRMQLQVCANTYQSRSSSYYDYEWRGPAPRLPDLMPPIPPVEDEFGHLLVITLGGNQQVVPGKDIRYVATVTNAGRLPQKDVRIVFDRVLVPGRMPPGWTCQQKDVSKAVADELDFLPRFHQETVRVLICGTSTLGSGESVSMTATQATVPANAGSDLTLRAYANAACALTARGCTSEASMTTVIR